MVGLNKIMIIGNVGTDPEMRYTPNGNPVTSFRIATSRAYTSANGERHEETEWFTVVAWNQLAEQCNQFLSKGQLVYVEGRLHSHSWDSQDGQKHFRNEIIADTVRFLSPRQGGAAPLPGGKAADDSGEELGPDDIPF